MTDDYGTPQPAQYAIPLFIWLAAAGMSGNWFALPLFMDVEFIFGSVFALLAMQFLGPALGLLAGLLISSVTFPLWHHPYNIAILTLEVAVVGWLHGHRRLVGLVAADTLYWCLVGVPLTFLFYLLAMQAPLPSIAPIAAKQAVNGIGNALIARFAFHGWLLASRQGRISSSEAIFNLLALFVLAPSLLLLTITSQADFNDADQRARDHLKDTSAVVTDRLHTWLTHRQYPIAYLAKLAETLPPAQMQTLMELMRATDPNLLRIGLMDAEATAIAYTPPFDDLGMETIGLNFSDRQYFDRLRQSHKPQLSEIMPGKVGAAPGQIVAALHPVLVNGTFQGYVGGVLDMQSLKTYLALSIENQGMEYILVDGHGRVILSNDPAQKVMSPFDPGQGVLSRLEGGLSQSVPSLPLDVSTLDRWRKSLYVTESDINSHSGWKLVLHQSLAPVRERLSAQFANGLYTLFGLLIAALSLASLLSQKIYAALEMLRHLSSGLPAKIASSEPINWPVSPFGESEQMIDNFKEMAGSLKKKFIEVNEMNATLEQRVAVRTRNLEENEERYRALFEAESDTIFLVDNESGRILEANTAASELYQYSHDEMLSRRNSDFSAEPQETKKITTHGVAAKSGLLVKIPLRLHRKKDGTVFPVEITGRFFMLQGRSVHIAAIRDITERKQAEAALKESEERFRKLLQHVPAVAVQGYKMDGTTFYWNDASETLYGYSAQEAIGLNLLSLIIPPEMRGDVRQAMQQMATTGQPIPSAELSLMRKDGSLVAVFSSHAIVQAHDREPELFCIDVDMSQVKEAQEALQKSETGLKEAQRLAHIGSWSWDAETDRIWWSEELYRILHFDPQLPPPNYHDHLKVYTPASMELLDAAVKKAIQTGKPYTLDLELADGNGGGRWLLARGEVRSDAEGRIIGLSGTAQDITNRKQNEELLRRALHEKEVLVKEVHHRVKNNMQVIYSLLNLQAKGIDDERVRTMFEESRNRVNSMALIHEQLYQANDLAHINFKEYLQSLIKSIGYTYNRPEVTVAVEMTAAIVLDVNIGIPCGLIVNELVSNSLKHAFPNGKAGEIRVGVKQGPADAYLLTVSDNGIGLPAGLDFKSTTSLGLQLVNVLAGQLHGTISLTQTAGSEFSILFPSSTNNKGIANG